MTPSLPSSTGPLRTHRSPLVRERESEDLEVLRCATTADFLAALPFLSGMTADDSLFIVAFDGKRAEATMRMDLPPSDDAQELRRFAAAVRQLLHRTRAGVRGPALVVTSSQSFAEQGGVPRAKLAVELRSLFLRRNWPLRDLAVVAADGWAGLLGPHAHERRPLSEIAASPVSREAAERVRAPRSPEEIAALPASDPELARRIAAQLDRAKAEDGLVAPLSDPLATAELADAVIRCPRASADPAACARLIRVLETDAGWLIAALTALTRPAFVGELLAEPQASSLLLESPFGADPPAAPAPRGPGRLERRTTVRDYLTSISAAPPQQPRMNDAIAAIARLAAHTPERRRARVLSLLAWLWWFCGKSAIAHRVLRPALAADPAEPSVRMVEAVNQSPPHWCFTALRQHLSPGFDTSRSTGSR